MPALFEIKITSEKQAQTIKQCFIDKHIKNEAEEKYNESKEAANKLVQSKIIANWKKTQKPEFGQYAFNLPDGTQHLITAQNQSSRKSFTPAEAKLIIEEIGCKGSDILDVVTKTEINAKLIKKPKINKRIQEVLLELEKEFRISGDLLPEESLVETTRDLEIVKHALPRLLAICEGAPEKTAKVTFEEALTKLKDPVTCLMIS